MFTHETAAMVYAFSSAVCAAAIIFLFRYRHSRVMFYLLLLLVTNFIWTFFGIFELLAVTVNGKWFWSVVMYLGTCLGPAFYLLYAVAYARREKILTPAVLVALFILPILWIVIAALNPLLHLIWPEIRIDPATNIAIYGHGPIFWLMLANIYIYLGAGIIMILFTLFHSPASRRTQALIMVLCNIPVLAGNLMYVSGFNLIPGFDWTPVGFIVSSIFISWGTLSRKFSDVVPIARNILIDNMAEAVLVLDAENRYLDGNPSAAELSEEPLEYGLELHRILPELKLNGDGNGRIVRERFSRESLHFEAVITSILSPGQELIGRLVVVRDITEDMERERQLRLLNEQLEARYIDVKEKHERVSQEAALDPLTGACNRRHLEQAAPELILTAQNEKTLLSLIIIDVDHFKTINDNYGHLAGDEFLILLARTVLRNVKGADLVCRYGGDEFIVLLSGASGQNALRLARKIGAEFAEKKLVYSGRDVSTTLSLGVAEFGCNGNTLPELIAAADKALYNVKRAGRNGAALA